MVESVIGLAVGVVFYECYDNRANYNVCKKHCKKYQIVGVHCRNVRRLLEYT
jgi:hypothetical protein